MARLGAWPITLVAPKTTVSVAGDPCGVATASTVNTNNSVVRRTSGNQRRSIRCQSTANTAGAWSIAAFGNPTLLRDHDYYLRFYFQVDALPASTIQILSWINNGSGGMISIDLTSAGKLQCWDRFTGNVAQIGSDSATTIAVNTWYRVEIHVRVSSTSGAHSTVEAYLYAGTNGDDTLSPDTLVNSTTVNLGNTASNAPGQMGFGWNAAPGTGTKTIYFCDIGLNDDTGSNGNTSWLGVGLLWTLFAASDNSRGSWTTGNGTASAVYDSINGGGASAFGLASPTSDSGATTTPSAQAKNAGGATDNGDFNLQDYTTAGLPSGEGIAAVGAVGCFGPNTTAALDSWLEMVSNPAITGKTLTGAATAVAAFATGWKWVSLTVADNPSVTNGTAPVIRIGKRTAGNTLECGAAMGWFESYPSSAPTANTATETESLSSVGVLTAALVATDP
jgi:hypothetical protein